jgi:hypothetical protein
LSFIKFCYPNDIFFITYLIKITYTSQLQHLKLTTTFHQINTPCATWLLSRNPQKDMAIPRKYKKHAMKYDWKKRERRKRLAMSKKRGRKKRDRAKGVQVHHSSHLHLLDQTGMMHYLYGSNLWSCNRCTASKRPFPLTKPHSNNIYKRGRTGQSFSKEHTHEHSRDILKR